MAIASYPVGEPLGHRRRRRTIHVGGKYPPTSPAYPMGTQADRVCNPHTTARNVDGRT